MEVVKLIQRNEPFGMAQQELLKPDETGWIHLYAIQTAAC